MPVPTITAEGRLTATPELRFIPSGKAVANFTLACSDRKKEGDEWVDGDKCFLNVTVWGTAAENVAETLIKGDEVLVQGKLSQREYETRDGEKRTAYQEVTAFNVAPSLRQRSATINRPQRGSQALATPTNDDPWGAQPAATEAPPY